MTLSVHFDDQLIFCLKMDENVYKWIEFGRISTYPHMMTSSVHMWPVHKWPKFVIIIFLREFHKKDIICPKMTKNYDGHILSPVHKWPKFLVTIFLHEIHKKTSPVHEWPTFIMVIFLSPVNHKKWPYFLISVIFFNWNMTIDVKSGLKCLLLWVSGSVNLKGKVHKLSQSFMRHLRAVCLALE